MAQARPASRRVSLLAVLSLAGLVLAQAQPAPYLLLQGPSTRTTYRFRRGEVLEWRLRGERELFAAPIVRLFPEANAVQLGDLLVSADAIAAVRHPRRSRGIKNYLRIQGLVNFGFIGAGLLISDTRENQLGFLAGAAGVSGLMILFGSVDRYAERDIGRRYLLTVAGGDLRVGDDPERG